MKSFLVIAALLGMTISSFAQTTYKLKRYSVGFEIKNAGLKVNGSFKDLKTTIIFSPSELEKSVIQANIDVNSINTGIDLRDKHLKGEEFFNTPKYPGIQIKSKKIVALSDGSFVATFDLTIKNITKTIEIPFTFSKSGSETIFSGKFELDRRDYEVGGSSIMMSDKVKVTIKVFTE
jgi:polyisoprenoid-binding protein YceI